jgi:flagellar basal-body rod protein FlgC
MSSILSIAASGLAAASQRLDVSADNVANAESDGPLPSASAEAQTQYPAAYAAQEVNQVAMPVSGTRAVVSDMQPGTATAYDPTAPYADKNDQVAAPNVDISNEVVQQAIASYEFAANADVMKTYQKMTQSLLDIET